MEYKKIEKHSVVKICEICGKDFIDETKSHCQRICGSRTESSSSDGSEVKGGNKECQLERDRRRQRAYYKSNDSYAAKAKRATKIYYKNNTKKCLAYQQLYRIENPEVIKYHNTNWNKDNRSEYSRKYNRSWRLKNLKYEQLSDKIKWRIKTTIPIEIIREKYSELSDTFIKSA